MLNFLVCPLERSINTLIESGWVLHTISSFNQKGVYFICSIYLGRLRPRTQYIYKEFQNLVKPLNFFSNNKMMINQPMTTKIESFKKNFKIHSCYMNLMDKSQSNSLKKWAGDLAVIALTTI